MPELDRLITIQSATEAQDASGQPIETWADLEADVPAEYMPVSGGEQFAAFQHLATAIARFRIRYRTDLTRKMRLIFEDETWNLRHFEEDRRFDRRQYLVLTAELIAAT
jgi:SPP1 family predicted phage head-tail adaptor